MTTRLLACAANDLERGESMTIEGAPPIALHRADDGRFYATDDICTHAELSLGTDGEVDGAEVICPLHMARFDLATGAALCLPATIALTTYPVDVEGDSVYVLV